MSDIETEKSIIILSGPAGAGKTTVAQHLIPLLDGPVAYIEGDKFWGFIAKDEGLGKLEKFKMIMRAITVAAIPYTRSGYRVIVDFPIPPWYLEVILLLTGRRQIPVDYVVLRPSLQVCASRTEGGIANYDQHQKLYDTFDDVQRHIICNNEADAVTIAGYIIEGLNEGSFHL